MPRYPRLFVNGEGKPLSFLITGCVNPRKLTSLIKEEGGRVVTKEGPHTVVLVQYSSLIDCTPLPNTNAFLTSFITDSVRLGRLLPLKNYWARKASDFSDFFDPHDVMIGVFSWDTCRRLPHPHPEERQESAALPPASASSASATNTLQKSPLKDCYVRLVRIDIQAARHTAMTDQADKEAQQTSPSDNTPDSPTQHQATPEQYEVERSPLKRRTRRGRPRKACLDTSVESGAFNQEAKQRRRNTRHVKKRRRKSLEVEVEEEEEDEPLQRKIRPVFPSHISKRQPRGRRGGRACRGIANFNERMKDGVCRGVMSSDDEDEAENKSNAGHSSGEESHRSECLFSMTNTTPEKEHNTNSRMSERQETTHSSHPDQPTQQEQADWDTAKGQPQTHTPRGKGRQPDIYTRSPEDSEDTTTLKQADKDTTFQRHREMNVSGHLEDTRRREGKETTPKPQQASTLTGKPSQPSHLSRQDSYCQASAHKCPLFVSPPLSGHSVRSEKKEPYSVHEDVDIVVYIDAFEEYHRLGGREMWQEMEHYFNHRRTWQSLKERFRKRIAPNLCVYVKLGLSRKVVDRMKHNIAIEYETGRRQRKSRKPFTVEEDRGILHFISSNHRFREVGGVIMWKEMASSCCELDNHTWHSLKQRFHKQILPNLRKYKLSRNTVLQLQSKKRIPKLDRVSASESDSSPDYIRKRKGSATPQQEAATKRRAKRRDTTDLDSDSSYPEVLSRPRHTYKSGKELKGRLTQGNRVSVPCTYKSKRKSRKVRDEEKSDTNSPPLVYRSKSKLRKVRDKEESDTDSLPLSYRSRSKSEQVRDEDERETDVFIPNTHLLERSGRVRGEGESEGGNDSPHKSRKKERRGRVREECEEESDNGSISHTHKSRKEKRERLRDESEGESDDEAILSTYKSKKKEKERQRDDSEEETDRFNPHTLRSKKKRKRRSAENEDVDDPNPYTHKSKKERRQRISDKTEEESDDDEDYVDNSMSRTGSKKSRRRRGRDESEEGSEDSDHPYSLVYPHLKRGRGRRQLLEVEHTMEMFEHTRKPQERTERTENTPKSNQRSIKEFLKAGRKGTSHSNSLTRRHRGREEEDEEEEEMDDDEEEVEEAEEVEVLEDEVVARFLTHQEYNKHENNTTSNTTKHCSFLKSIRKPLYSQDFTADISPKTPFRNNTLHSRRRLTRKEPEETSAIDTETEGKVDTVEDDDGDSVHSLTLDIMPDVKKRVQERREKANVCEKDMMEVLEDVPEKDEEEEEEEDMLSLSLDFSVERNKCSQRKVTQEGEKKEDIPQEVIEEEEEDVSVVEEEELEKEDDMPDRVIEEHEEEEEVEEVNIAEVIEKDEEEEEVEEEIPQEEVVEHEVEEEKEDEIPLEVIEEDEEKEDDNLQEKLTQEQEEKEDKQNKIQEEERRKKEDDKQNKTQEDEGKKGDDKPNKVTQEHEEEEEDDNIPNKMQKHEKEKEHNTSVEVIEEEKEEDMPHKAQEHEEEEEEADDDLYEVTETQIMNEFIEMKKDDQPSLSCEAVGSGKEQMRKEAREEEEAEEEEEEEEKEKEKEEERQDMSCGFISESQLMCEVGVVTDTTYCSPQHHSPHSTPSPHRYSPDSTSSLPVLCTPSLPTDVASLETTPPGLSPDPAVQTPETHRALTPVPIPLKKTSALSEIVKPSPSSSSTYLESTDHTLSSDSGDTVVDVESLDSKHSSRTGHTGVPTTARTLRSAVQGAGPSHTNRHTPRGKLRRQKIRRNK